MDNLKICDTRFEIGNKSSFLKLLKRKSRNGFSKNSDSLDTTISIEKSNITKPTFTFRIKDFEVN